MMRRCWVTHGAKEGLATYVGHVRVLDGRAVAGPRLLLLLAAVVAESDARLLDARALHFAVRALAGRRDAARVAAARLVVAERDPRLLDARPLHHAGRALAGGDRRGRVAAARLVVAERDAGLLDARALHHVARARVEQRAARFARGELFGGEVAHDGNFLVVTGSDP